MNVVLCLRMSARTSAALLDAADARTLARATALRAAGHTVTAVYSAAVAEAEAIAAGLAPLADRVVRVAGDDLTTADFHTVGLVLATAIRRIGADLVLAPVQGTDEPFNAAPAAIARQLGARYLPLVEEIVSLDQHGAEVSLCAGGLRRRIRATLPAVLTTAPAPGPLPEDLAARGGAVAVETMTITDPDATVVRRRLELLGRPEPASRGSLTVGSAAEMVACLSRR